MTKRTRWLLLFACISLFLVGGYLTVVYALGWQYDLSKRQFVRTGSFRVVTNTATDVYINGVKKGDTSFLSNTFSKSYLLPRTYTVELKKEGYRPWKKSFRLEAGLFTDFPTALLIRTELPIEVVPTRSFDLTDEIFFSPSGEFHTRNRNRVLIRRDNELMIEWTSNTDYQPFQREGDRQVLITSKSPITQAVWYKDHNHILYATGGVLYLTELDSRGGLNIYEITSLSSITLPTGQAGTKWHYDRDEDAVYVEDGLEMKRIDLD